MTEGVVIGGGGPAGMVAGLLFARAGVRTTVLEKHGDFLRDFRGDTVHPSTLDLFDELGLFDALLEQPHDKVTQFGMSIGGRDYPIADFRHLPGRGKFIAMMPQWHFLNFVAEQARQLPAFTLRMQTEVIGLLDRGGRVTGVRLKDGEEIGAKLVIACDGRGSILRGQAHLPVEDLGAPIDVFWFRVGKDRAARDRTGAFIGHGEMVVLIDRGDYFQCARVIGKGLADAVRARGIEAFRAEVAAAAPPVADVISGLGSFDDIKLLTVELNRLRRWHAPGLLAIGDAAHAMSPVGGGWDQPCGPGCGCRRQYPCRADGRRARRRSAAAARSASPDAARARRAEHPAPGARTRHRRRVPQSGGQRARAAAAVQGAAAASTATGAHPRPRHPP